MSANTHCSSCKNTEAALLRMERRLMRIEYMLKKNTVPEVKQVVLTDKFKIPQTEEEFEEHEAKLDDERYANWLRQFLTDTSQYGSIPLSRLMSDSIAANYSFSGRYGKRAFERTKLFNKIYLRECEKNRRLKTSAAIIHSFLLQPFIEMCFNRPTNIFKTVSNLNSKEPNFVSQLNDIE